MKIIRLSLKEDIETIFDPVVLIRSELVKKRVLETENDPVRTLTFTLFCALVVSKISPVATDALIPSLRDKIDPLV